MEKSARPSRDLSTREVAERPKQWMPPKLLPDPIAEEGYKYRWIRIATQGKDDGTNYSSKLALNLPFKLLQGQKSEARIRFFFKDFII